ncbi:DUF5994 family protein [Streptomyces sp. 549]|uniref:DUF5994 family protein n=1 Tax=Streptomyces sp. 549 TaxID=3049076 RepID=UPI0032E35CFA
MVITERHVPTRPVARLSGHLPVRLSLRPPGPLSGLLDGAWWPRRRDLTRGLPSLTGLLNPPWGRIARGMADSDAPTRTQTSARATEGGARLLPLARSAGGDGHGAPRAVGVMPSTGGGSAHPQPPSASFSRPGAPRVSWQLRLEEASVVAAGVSHL